ncbi:MAG: glycosyltransferase family 2 protein [Microgenomates group bacterium]|jgi:glycosyltransferase involved in cell wall biosynthesis
MKIDALSVFFPAFNEEENITSTITKANDVLASLSLKDYEIIVVDDGSKDKTVETVNNLIKTNKHIRLVSHEVNKGYGEALKTGFREAKFPWVAFADADGQFDFAEITKLMDETDKADFILGYRLRRADPFVRIFFNVVWIIGARILFDFPSRDYSCGFKLIKKSAFDATLPLQAGEKVTQIEMLVKAKRLGFKFAEVGVHHYPRMFGKSTGGNLLVVFKSYLDLIKLWWKLH